MKLGTCILTVLLGQGLLLNAIDSHGATAGAVGFHNTQENPSRPTAAPENREPVIRRELGFLDRVKELAARLQEQLDLLNEFRRPRDAGETPADESALVRSNTNLKELRSPSTQ